MNHNKNVKWNRRVCTRETKPVLHSHPVKDVCIQKPLLQMLRADSAQRVELFRCHWWFREWIILRGTSRVPASSCWFPPSPESDPTRQLPLLTVVCGVHIRAMSHLKIWPKLPSVLRSEVRKQHTKSLKLPQLHGTCTVISERTRLFFWLTGHYVGPDWTVNLSI